MNNNNETAFFLSNEFKYEKTNIILKKMIAPCFISLFFSISFLIAKGSDIACACDAVNDRLCIVGNLHFTGQLVCRIENESL